ncbi:MAG: NAD-dependent epimerase/dehydratase family protein [Myxococcota bacterium]
MRHAFVTGGTGFVGSNIIECLLADGWRVTALHRESSNTARLKAFDVETVSGVMYEPESMLRAMPEEVDAVFHVAGNTSIWRPEIPTQNRDNIDGTSALVNAAKARGARRFVFTSSWSTYGRTHDVVSEDTPQLGDQNHDNYSRSKLAGERIVLNSGLDAVIMHPSHILGRFDSGNWSRLIKMVDDGTLPGIPPGAGSFCHGHEVAKAHIAAVDKAESGAHYLLGGVDTTFLDVLQRAAERLGRKIPSKPVHPTVFLAVAMFRTFLATFTRKAPTLTTDGARMVLAHPRIVSDRAVLELGYVSASLDVMLDDAIGWMRKEGLLNAS